MHTLPQPAGASNESLLIGAAAAAELMGVSARTLWTLTDSASLPHVRIGRRVMYRPESLRAWLAARERGIPHPEPPTPPPLLTPLMPSTPAVQHPPAARRAETGEHLDRVVAGVASGHPAK